jgi:hypothetical protein
MSSQGSANTAGRGEANCRPFAESALRCVQVMRNLRLRGARRR